MFKVRNAVILAAGKGKRMGRLRRTPKPLMEVNGKIIIEDLILKLKASQIYDITVVTGYYYKEFEYLVKKFGVKIIYDPKWKKGNSTNSLIAAANNISNTLILHGDIMMKENYMFKEFEAATIYGEINRNLEKPMLLVSQDKHLINMDDSAKDTEGVYFRDAIFVDEQLARQFYPARESIRKIEGFEFALLTICKKHNIYFNVQFIPFEGIQDFDTDDQFYKFVPNKKLEYGDEGYDDDVKTED